MSGVFQLPPVMAAINADLDGLKAGFKTAVKQADEFKGRFEKQLGDLGGAKSGEGFLRSLKQKLGEESGLGLGLKTAIGGGALAAIGIAADQFAKMGAKIKEASLAGETWQKTLVSSLPVIGNVFNGVMDIGDAVSGWTARQNQLKRELAETLSFTKQIAEFTAALSRNSDDYYDSVAAMNQQLKELRANPLELAAVRATGEKDQLLRDLTHEIEGKRKEEEDRFTKAMEEANKFKPKNPIGGFTTDELRGQLAGERFSNSARATQLRETIKWQETMEALAAAHADNLTTIDQTAVQKRELIGKIAHEKINQSARENLAKFMEGVRSFIADAGQAVDGALGKDVKEMIQTASKEQRSAGASQAAAFRAPELIRASEANIARIKFQLESKGGQQDNPSFREQQKQTRLLETLVRNQPVFATK